jgi:hypothetical protein
MSISLRRYLGICLLLLTINLYYFSGMFAAEGYLYFNDFAPPASQSLLKKYVSTISIYNSNVNYGSPRLNFFNEYAPLLFILIISFVFSYKASLALFFVLGFTIIQAVQYIFFLKVTKGSTVLSFVLSLLSTYTLWSYDRIQQGHYFNLMFFLPVASAFLYTLYFDISARRPLRLGILFSLSLCVYYHYTFMLGYLWAISFCSEFFFSGKKHLKIFIDHLTAGVVFLALSLVFLLPYIYSIATFSAISSAVSADDTLRLFSWQSSIVSTLFHLRTGMWSFQLLSNFTEILYMLGASLLLALAFPFAGGRRAVTLYFSALLLAFLAFSYSLFPEFTFNYLYKFPTMSVFRDMNKFTGVSILLLLYGVAGNAILLKKYIAPICAGLALMLLPFLPGYHFFTYQSDTTTYFPQDINEYAAVAVPSYPLSSVRRGELSFHTYLPVFNSANSARSIFIPYAYQVDPQSSFKRLMYSDLYRKWDGISEEAIYATFRKIGVKYIYFYKHANFSGNAAEAGEWHTYKNVAKKLSGEYLIFNSDELSVYSVPGEIKSIVSVDGVNIRHLKLSPGLIEIPGNYKYDQDVEALIPYDKSWKLYQLPNGKSVCHTSSPWCYARNTLLTTQVYFLQRPIEGSLQSLYGLATTWTLRGDGFDEEQQNGLIMIYAPEILFRLGILCSLISALIVARLYRKALV